MKRTFLTLSCVAIGCTMISCDSRKDENPLIPVVITEPVRYDSEDPAIWINKNNPEESLVLATDKNRDGSLYVFNLKGKAIPEKTVTGIARPNNVDVAYGFILNGKPVDIAVVTERLENRIRVFRLPDMTAIDNGGLPVFEGEEHNAPMGIALYKKPADGSMYAIISRKQGPTDGSYLWQYLIEDTGNGSVTATKVRAFGKWSAQNEIEAVAVDNELGYVYYSDEGVGIRKYHADPYIPHADKELALFGTEGFAEDREGIAIWKTDDTKGYIIVSDQAAGKLRLFKRNGKNEEYPHHHELVRVEKTSATETDGIETGATLLTPDYPSGLLVVMSDDKTYHYYSLKDLVGK